jgi:hypothetical protein
MSDFTHTGNNQKSKDKIKVSVQTKPWTYIKYKAPLTMEVGNRRKEVCGQLHDLVSLPQEKSPSMC